MMAQWNPYDVEIYALLDNIRLILPIIQQVYSQAGSIPADHPSIA